MLRQDKAPFLFLALIGLLTWSLNNIIENAKLSPLVEYEFAYEDEHNGKLMFTNLSSSSRLEKLTFNLCSSDSDQSTENIFSKAIIEAIEPAYLVENKIKQNSIGGRCFDFTIEEMQPNSEFVVHYEFNASEAEILKLKSSEGQTVRIVESNMLTFAIRNQLVLNIFLFVSSLVILFLYFIVLLNRPERT
ncbi:hypothetical protein [Marivirga harenae]|uniref:hypothetical protein n=1 Tax=Marivirga harenae TaxID=2010992 RepID=UPI0026DEDAD9|nr:hypothetical protein [Marivirga harenae]WKV12639.1 hypothetical protein Q3Y49_02170 [Marivirga harenae]|tara:strand:- start:3600 stop:4169 length:570 start_codon:yes stop_codon:yes gene_type:complete